MSTTKTQELDDFCQLLVISLQSMEKANAIPSYVNGKAREINASQLSKSFLDKVENTELLRQFKSIQSDRKICSDEGYRTKESIIALAKDVKPLIDRVKSGSFKLMLDRFISAHEFAIQLSDLIEELGLIEEAPSV